MKPESKFPLLVFAVAVIWKTGLLLTGLNDSFLGKYPLLLVFGLLLIGMFRAVDARRKIDYPNGITSMPVFKIAMSVATLFTLMYSVFIYFYITAIDLDFRSNFIAKRVDELKASDTPQVDIDAWIKGAEDFPFAMTWVLFTFVGLMLISVFYAMAIARMMARKHPLIQQSVQLK
ncbi:MAG: DUF4199 family protein [Bacteroidia bacterium]